MLDPRSVDAELRAPRDAALARIEDAGLNTAQPPEQLLVDGWLMRFSPGKARRGRSVNAVSAGRLPLAEKLAIARYWYAQFRLPLLFRITPFSRPAELDDFLAGSDFVAFDETRVMTRALDGDRDVAGDASLGFREVDATAFAEAVGALRDSPQRQREAHARRLLASPLAAFSTRLVAYGHADDRPVAAGQVVVERECAGLYDIVTSTDARGRGFGRAISERLLNAGRALGARIAYLQVDAGNAPARKIYLTLGFVDRYAYWYRRPSGVPDEVLPEEGCAT